MDIACLYRDWPRKFANGLKYVTKRDNLFSIWPNFGSKIGVLGVLGVDNLHKKFGDDIFKIANFFLIYNFWG